MPALFLGPAETVLPAHGEFALASWWFRRPVPAHAGGHDWVIAHAGDPRPSSATSVKQTHSLSRATWSRIALNVAGSPDRTTARNARCRLVVAHLAEHGAMRPVDLMRRLALSSGGITAVIARLEADGWVTRRRHPSDGRSILLTLSDREHVERAARLYAPLTTALEVLAAEFTPEQVSASIALLDRAADITALHAERLCREAPARPVPSGVQPALWA